MGSQQENPLRSAQGRDWPVAGMQAGALVTTTYQWRTPGHLSVPLGHTPAVKQGVFCLGSASEDAGL